MRGQAVREPVHNWFTSVWESGLMKQHPQLVRIGLPLLVGSIGLVAQRGSIPVPVIIGIVALAGVGIAATLLGSVFETKPARAGRTDEITADVAARGRSVADDLFAQRPSNR